MAYNGLCFTANRAGSTVELCKRGLPSIANTAYSLDGETWVTFTPEDYDTSTGANKVTLANTGDKVYFRNDITGNFSDSSYIKFKMTGIIAASGNCNSMYSASSFENLTTLTYNWCFSGLFHLCSSLTSAPDLPATTTSLSCYQYMFNGCTSLVIAPKIAAVSLATNCFAHMFWGCTSLKIVPELLADNLKSGSYSNMFTGCRSLQVSDTLTAEAPYAWRIPKSGTFTNTDTYDQAGMFTNCAGTRASDTMTGAQGESHTYYTQNKPRAAVKVFLKTSSGKILKTSSGKILYV